MAIGITFSEVMAGGFALGESDPESGKTKGDAAGTQLVMNAEVGVPDLDAFIADPNHLGTLAGTIDFAPLGAGMASHSGVFNLFSPSGEPDLKLMVYEMGIRSGGKDYYVAGRKKVKDDCGFDLWSDTTTLYTTLHEGTNKEGPVVGAGILSLGVKDLTELLSTVKVTGTDSPTEKAATIAKFGKFFMGELWDTYGIEAVKALKR